MTGRYILCFLSLEESVHTAQLPTVPACFPPSLRFECYQWRQTVRARGNQAEVNAGDLADDTGSANPPLDILLCHTVQTETPTWQKLWESILRQPRAGNSILLPSNRRLQSNSLNRRVKLPPSWGDKIPPSWGAGCSWRGPIGGLLLWGKTMN